jgi:hypothetical protein
MDIPQLKNCITELANKDDADCNPEELQVKELIAFITTEAIEKKNEATRQQCLAKAPELVAKLKHHTETVPDQDMVELNNLKADKKDIDAQIRNCIKKSENAEQFIALGKQEKKLRAELGRLNKKAVDLGLDPVFSGRKKAQPDDGEARPMDTGDDEDEESDSGSEDEVEDEVDDEEEEN